MGSPSFVKSPMFNIAFLLVTMQLSKKINWDNPDTLLYARISYYAAQALTILMAYGLIELIKKRNGKVYALDEWGGLRDVCLVEKLAHIQLV